MKLRTILLTANFISIAIMVVFLVIAYIKMVLSVHMIILLSMMTLGGGILSALAHYLLTSPILQSIQLVVKQSKTIASGDFNGQVPVTGPVEMKELAKSFNEMNDQLSTMFTQLTQSEESRKQLIANVSHDLRTPLASIQSYVEALQDGVIQDEETKASYLKTILAESERLDVLIEDLFQLSQLQAGKLQFTPVSYHVDQLLLESIQPFELKLKQNDLDIKVHIDADLPSVQMVPDQMRRVLTNLIQNAIRYSPAKSVIWIEAFKEQGNLLIKVRDQGIGIETGELEKIFERFYRIDKSRNKQLGGSGLGLAIAKEIVELHGGEIGAESTIGKGSCFWFKLPI